MRKMVLGSALCLHAGRGGEVAAGTRRCDTALGRSWQCAVHALRESCAMNVLDSVHGPAPSAWRFCVDNVLVVRAHRRLRPQAGTDVEPQARTRLGVR